MELQYFNLKIDRELWTKFKDRVPRSIKLNDKIISLIEGYIQNANN